MTRNPCIIAVFFFWKHSPRHQRLSESWPLEPPAEGDSLQSRIPQDPFHGASIERKDDRDCHRT